MTREEAISILSRPITMKNTPKDILEAHKIAIKELEQQPCNDAISRQAVLDCFKKWQPYMATRLLDFEKELSELPPVTPQPKTGKWFIDGSESDREIVCSNCEQHIFKYHKLDFDYRPKYCPNCGAKMQEVEE